MTKMTMKDVDRLAKILELTASNQDSESASAARKATVLLAKHGFRWSEFFQALTKVDQKEIGHLRAECQLLRDQTRLLREELRREKSKKWYTRLMTG